jgi:hypothetical protein
MVLGDGGIGNCRSLLAGCCPAPLGYFSATVSNGVLEACPGLDFEALETAAKSSFNTTCTRKTIARGSKEFQNGRCAQSKCLRNVCCSHTFASQC